MLKHLKNCYTKEIKRAKIRYYKSRYKTTLGKWKTLPEEELNEDKILSSAVVNGKVVSSQEELANKYSKSFLNKLEEIKKE